MTINTVATQQVNYECFCTKMQYGNEICEIAYAKTNTRKIGEENKVISEFLGRGMTIWGSNDSNLWADLSKKTKFQIATKINCSETRVKAQS